MPLDASTTLDDGTRVRVRLPHRTDRSALPELHERLGQPVDELELARLLRFDPRTRVVACLTGWDGTTQHLLGYGAIDVGEAEPHLLVVDLEGAPGAQAVLADALRLRARRLRAVA